MMEITVPQAEALWLIGEALLKQARTGVRFSVLPLISLGFQPQATLPVVQRVILSSCHPAVNFCNATKLINSYATCAANWAVSWA